MSMTIPSLSLSPPLPWSESESASLGLCRGWHLLELHSSLPISCHHNKDQKQVDEQKDRMKQRQERNHHLEILVQSEREDEEELPLCC
jgi:hypothetical protein